MRYLTIILTIILTVILFSCQKQEYKQVIYSLEHSGNGVLKYKFDTQKEYRELSNTVFDTAWVIPDNKNQYKIHYWHHNEANNFSSVKMYIIIDGFVKDSLVQKFNSCKGISGILTYYE